MLCFAASPAAAETKAKKVVPKTVRALPSIPSKTDLLALVHAASSTKLNEKSNPGCSPTMGSTVGSYLAFLFGSAASDQDTSPKDRLVVRADCQPAHLAKHSLWAPPAGTDLLECEVGVHWDLDPSGDSWDYALRFRLKRDRSAIDEKFVACPGSP